MLKIPSEMSKVAGNESVPEQIDDDDRRSSQNFGFFEKIAVEAGKEQMSECE